MVCAILLVFLVVMATVIIAPCNVATERSTAWKQTLLPTQRMSVGLTPEGALRIAVNEYQLKSYSTYDQLFTYFHLLRKTIFVSIRSLFPDLVTYT